MSIISVQIPWDQVWNFLKNILKSRVLFALVFIIIGGALAYNFFVKPLQEENLQLSKEVRNFTASLEQAIDFSNESSPKCVSGKFPDDKDDWIIHQYDKPDEEGFYCPRLRSDFLSPDIWYVNSIPTEFESLEFRYKVRNRNNNSDTSPTFIISFGKDPTIFRLYLPLESNSQLLGFEKIVTEDSKYDLEREESKKLKKPVKEEVENELKIRIIIEQDNKVTFLFNPIYISAIIEEESMSVNDSVTYSFYLPHDPKPGSEFSQSEIGFGTIKGSCVKPISYKFCY